MTSPHVLVAGAGIAGPALALWLRRYGWRATVVERSPALRTSGQNVDVRGAGREVLRRSGIEDDVRRATTGERGTRFVRRDGTTLGEFPAGTTDSGGATAELEILRGDLARLLVDRTPEDVEFRYGDRVTAIVDHGDAPGAGVTVSFEHAPEERFDLVVAADGIGSSTRDLVFGDEVEVRPLGLETTYATIPRTAADDDWWRWCGVRGGRTMGLRPDRVGTIRATLSWTTPRPPRGSSTRPPRRSLEEQRALLHERFDDAGWEARRILDGVDATDEVYSESVSQVRAPRWSSGRVALLGDAGYCASPVSGMGTSLALVGAYVLAGELAAHTHHRDAFAAYERILRPYVQTAQKLPPGVPRIANPSSRAGVAAFGLGVRLAAGPLVGRLAERFSTPPAEGIDLPHHEHLLVDA